MIYNPLYQFVRSSNMKQLARSYSFCINKKCSFPINCALNLKPTIYTVYGKYKKSSNKSYNTILTFKQNSIIKTYVPLTIFVTVAAKENPTEIMFSAYQKLLPTRTIVPAATNNIIIKLYFNVYNC